MAGKQKRVAIVATFAVITLFQATADAAWYYLRYDPDLRPTRRYVYAGQSEQTARAEAQQACDLGTQVLALYDTRTGKQSRFSCSGGSGGGSSPSGGDSRLDQLKKSVQQAYQNAKNARNWASQRAGRLSRSQYNSTNSTIDRYNNTLRSAQSSYPSQFRSYRPMGRIPSSWLATATYRIYALRKTAGSRWFDTGLGPYTNQRLAGDHIRILRQKYGSNFYFRLVESGS